MPDTSNVPQWTIGIPVNGVIAIRLYNTLVSNAIAECDYTSHVLEKGNLSPIRTMSHTSEIIHISKVS